MFANPPEKWAKRGRLLFSICSRGLASLAAGRGSDAAGDCGAERQVHQGSARLRRNGGVSLPFAEMIVVVFTCLFSSEIDFTTGQMFSLSKWKELSSCARQLPATHKGGGRCHEIPVPWLRKGMAKPQLVELVHLLWPNCKHMPGISRNPQQKATHNKAKAKRQSARPLTPGWNLV